MCLKWQTYSLKSDAKTKLISVPLLPAVGASTCLLWQISRISFFSPIFGGFVILTLAQLTP